MSATGEQDDEKFTIKMECNTCDEKYLPSELVQCAHEDCDTDEKVYCRECLEWIHKKKKKGHTPTEKPIIIQEETSSQIAIQSIEHSLRTLRTVNEMSHEVMILFSNFCELCDQKQYGTLYILCLYRIYYGF